LRGALKTARLFSWGFGLATVKKSKCKPARNNKKTGGKSGVPCEAIVRCFGPADFEKIRSGIVNLVCNQALEAVDEMMEHVRAGNVPAMKYLFEMAGLFPGGSSGPTETDESLTEKLLCYLESSQESAADLEIKEPPTRWNVAPDAVK
jgi:hypothetical protein